MQVRLLAFASAAEAISATESVLDVEDGSTVGELRGLLERRHPELGPLWTRLAIAVDGEIAAPETPLHAGCEVALLPPVSGGSGERASLVDGSIDVSELAASLEDPDAGALLIFFGRPRAESGGRVVRRLDYAAYRPMATAALERIAADLERKADGVRIRIVHRLGEVAIGQPSVAIAVSSPHRDAAYELSREALERLKREAPIWKREIYADGAPEWREEEPLIALPEASRPAT